MAIPVSSVRDEDVRFFSHFLTLFISLSHYFFSFWAIESQKCTVGEVDFIDSTAGGVV